MKAVTLIFSVIIAIIAFFFSLIAYPLIASFFESKPTLMALLIGSLIFIIVTIITTNICKSKNIRTSIILPCLICVVSSYGIMWSKFGWSYYNNGYLEHGWDLYNSIGSCVINNGGRYYYKGVDEYGNEIIIGLRREHDWDYDSDTEEKYDYYFKYYNADYQFIGDDHRTVYYQYGEDEYDDSDFNDAKYLIEYYDRNFEITVYESIGWGW